MFFKHKYLTQPSVTPLDAVLRASDDLCDVLRGTTPVKGQVWTAVDMLMDIFKNVGKKDENEVDNQRANMSAAAKARSTSEQSEDQGVWIEPDEVNLADDDLRTTENIQISHSSDHLSHSENPKIPGQERVNPESRGTRMPKRGKMGPNLIKEDQPRSRVTRASTREKMLFAVDISGSCPTPSQAARRKFPL